MMGPVGPVPHEMVSGALANGAPGLLRGVGRAFGLGDAEQNALAGGSLPWWLYVTIGVGVGVIAGIQLQKRAPSYAGYLGGG